MPKLKRERTQIAKAIKKKKGYNIYPAYVSYSGYGFVMDLYATQVKERPEKVLLLFSQTFPNIPNYRAFFTPSDFRLNGQEVDGVKGYRLLRRLADKLEDSDFNLTAIQTIKYATGAPTRRARKPRVL